MGATENEGSVGRTVMQNLAPFKGEVFPVNPKRPSVLGIKAYPDLKSIPKKVELIVIVTPAKAVPQIIQEASQLKIPAAVIISAGFKEMGPPGEALEQEILRYARANQMRIIGPNCLGIMNPVLQFNATFANGMAHPGNIAFISQSGALCTAVLDWSLAEKVGFSAFVSIGSMIDVDWGDLIDYFGNDPATQSILIYMESIGNARSFLSAARAVSLTKPIVLIKAGRSAESAKAAASHTGALAGSDEAFNAAVRRVGILRVDTIAELFNVTEALAKQPRPKGPRLMIMTNAGGPGVIATDALIASGGQLAEVSPSSMEALNQILPAPWSHNNPVDILGDADAQRYAKSMEIVSKDPGADGILVILTPQDMTDAAGSASQMKAFAKLDKPVLASWMGAKSVAKGDQILTEEGIPSFAFPDMACRTFSLMWKYTDNLSGIYEVPSSVDLESVDSQKITKIIEQARKEHRTILDEVESKQVLEAYHIPCTPTLAAHSAKEAAALAKKIGFPVVLKVYSRTITHKTDVGGVKLNLANEEAVEKAYKDIYESVKRIAGEHQFQGVTVQPMIKQEGYELILGSTIDEQFGPVILFGSGGQLVEVYKDRALAIPPLTTTLARRMMEQTKIYEALKGVRGRKAVDLEKLEEILVQFSHLVTTQSWIKECDINPLMASADKLIALDARVILHDPNTKDLPKLAIRPYPSQYVEQWKLKDGTSVTIRPIRPEDEPQMIQFHKDLSQETVRQRYLKEINYDERAAHSRLLTICFADYDRELAFIVEKGEEILGVIRLTRIPGTQEAIFALTVKDRWQHKGIGFKLMEKLVEAAQKEGVHKIQAYMLKENTQMQKLCKHFGFTLQSSDPYIFTEKALSI